MTRFARAKGSKASNERVVNEATPWHVMKEQLEDNIAMKKHQPTKGKSAKQLLSEKDAPFYVDTIGNVNNEWAEFGTSGAEKATDKKSKVTSISKESENKVKRTLVENRNCISEVPFINDNGITPKCKKNKNNSKISISDDKSNIQTAVVEAGDISTKKSSVKRKSDVSLETPAVPPAAHSEIVDNATEAQPDKKKRKKKDKKPESSAVETIKVLESAEKPEVKENDNSEIKETSGKISKRHKRNQKRKNKMASEKAAADGVLHNEKPEVGISGGFDAAGNDWSSNVNFGKQSKLDSSGKAEETGSGKNLKKSPNRPSIQQNGQKRKTPKIRDDKEHKRRKPDGGAIKCVINGMEVEIVKYDGFPVKREDAERLKELRQKMIMKGIPKKEIDVAMKLERRKAEKALARVRKQVCFHCRKAGHNLSDCPELGNEESATGICFKCGSTEHTHYECKVTKKEEYRFASCFICREQGHIAKQCPDNPRGLYPQGGACKVCGDVTHLKKDCPDLIKENEESIVTLGMIAENTLESLDDDETIKIIGDGDKKPKSKIVKF